MWKSNHYLCLLTALLIGACAPDPLEQPGELDIRNLTADEAADVVSEAICTKMAQCPYSQCECWAEPGSPTECSCEIVYADEVECTEEMYEEIQEDFQRAELTPDQEVAVNDCINAYVRRDCLTVAQVEANNDSMEAGGEPIYEEEMPAQCEILDEIFGGEEPTPSPQVPSTGP